jgi:ATP-dependent Clp protease ATP-binding subunit ClpC
MQTANKETQRYNHTYIGSEHILLGFIADESSAAMAVLRRFNISADQIRSRVDEAISGPEVTDISPKFPQTPRAKKIIEYSMDEARRLGHH